MTRTPAPALGARLRQLRHQAGLDQATLAARVEARLGPGRGFDPSYLSKIERARAAPPSAPVLLALAQELGADPDEILALAGRPPRNLAEALTASPAARAFWREASALPLTDGDWSDLLAEARRHAADRGHQ